MADVRLKGVGYGDIRVKDGDISKLIDAFNENKRVLEWALHNLTGDNFNNNNITIPPVDPAKEAPVDSYGINELYLDFYPNLCYNSGFEKYDSTTLKPEYWDTDGVVSAASRFESTCSLMLTAGQYAQQKDDDLLIGLPDPAWYTWATDTRYAFWVKGSGGSVTVSVIQGGNPLPLWKWEKNAKGELVKVYSVYPGHTLTFAIGIDWPIGRINFAATPSPTGGKMALRIVNAGAITLYTDAVKIIPDWTGRYAGLYKPGAKSTGAEAGEEYDEYGVADWSASATTFTFEQAYLYMPEWMKAAWFLDVGAGAGAEVTAAIDFSIKLVQESFTVGGVATLCYSKAIVTPISTSVPATIANGKISFRALCRGAVAKPA
jgi:hypothetical protein